MTTSYVDSGVVYSRLDFCSYNLFINYGVAFLSLGVDEFTSVLNHCRWHLH